MESDALDRAQKALLVLASWLEEWWPADVFDGSSGDPGPLQIIAHRAMIVDALGADSWETVLYLARDTDVR
jgi:hypothetical protein